MFISDFAIKRPLITVVSMLALVVFGLISLFKLQTDEFPDVAPPIVTVGLIYPGASPDGVERELLDPVEEAISSIAGVKHVNGRAEDGFGSLYAERARTLGGDLFSCGIKVALPLQYTPPHLPQFSMTSA